MDRVLSFCIPTYNRAQYLDNNLENLVALARIYDIPIYISDNCSTDSTREIVMKHKAKYPYIFYSRNKSNEGFNKNCQKAICLSSTDYSWLLGDDDMVIGERFSTVYNALTTNCYDLVLVNGITDVVRVRNRASEIIEDENYFLMKYGENSTWISTLIFGKRIIEYITNTGFDKVNAFPHTITIFKYLKESGCYVYWLNEIAVKVQRHESDYNVHALDYYIKHVNYILCNIGDYSIDAKRGFALNFAKGVVSLRSLLVARASGYMQSNASDYYANELTYFPWYTKVDLFLIEKLPISFLNKLYKAYREHLRKYIR